MPYKTGSWGEQAKERYLRRKKSGYWTVSGEWSLGKKGEIEAQDLLPESQFVGGLCDMKWRGKKIEVKTSRLGKSTVGYRWKFDLRRQIRKADYFLFLCKDRDDKTKFILLIPDGKIKAKSLSIDESCINKYKDYFWKRGELCHYKMN